MLLEDEANFDTAADSYPSRRASSFAQFHKELFEGHFVSGEDLGDPALIDRHARASGVDIPALHAGLADGTAMQAVTAAEMLGRKHSVQGTPAWLFAQGLVIGLRPAREFERLANKTARLAQ